MRYDELISGDYSGKPNLVFEETLELKDYDSDENGNLTLKGILQAIQDTAMHHMVVGDASVDALISEKILLFVIRMKLEVLRFPKAFEKIRSKTWLYYSKRRGVLRYHLIETLDGELLAQLVGRWVCVNSEERHMYPVEVFNERWRYQYPEMTDCPAPGGVKPALELDKKYELTIDESLLDMYGHVNNCEYAGFVDGALKKYALSGTPKLFEINYNSEARLGDTLNMSLGFNEDVLELEATHGRGVCFKARAEF